jgi:hypothetical protein
MPPVSPERTKLETEANTVTLQLEAEVGAIDVILNRKVPYRNSIS